MSTETINIVVAESGAPEAAAGIESIGKAAAASDVALTDLLARSGTTSAAMTAITNSSGAAGAALQTMTTGATGATASLLAAGQEAASASARIAAVGGAGSEAAAGMGTAGTAGTALAFSLREASAAAAAATAGETEVAAAAAREAAAHVAAAASVRGHATAQHALGEESGVLQNKLERLELTFVALGLALGAHALIELTDSYANMSNQLIRVSVSADDFKAKQEDIFRIAQESRQPLEAVNSVYVNMSMALRGMDPTRVSRAIETLTKAASISGRSIDETSSALTRLGISMRQGDVNGRGFLQFLVQMPEVGERVAQALGFVGAKGFDNFVKAANGGEISTAMFIKALNKISPAVDSEMKHMEVTISSAFVTVKNAFERYIGDSDRAAGASKHVAEAIEALADHIQLVVGVIASVTIGLATYGVVVGTAALVTGVLAFSMSAIIGLLAAAAVAVYFFGNAVKLTSDGSVTLFSAIVGTIRTLISSLGDLITWMTTTTNGALTLGGVIATLGVIIARIAFESILTGLSSLAKLIAVAVPIVLGLVGALALLIVEYLAVRYATVALTQGIAAANQDMSNMKDTIVKMASDIKDKFSANISDTAGPLQGMKSNMDDASFSADKMGVTIVRAGQASGKGFGDLSKAGQSAAVTVINAMDKTNSAVSGMATNTQKAAGSVQSSMNEIAGSTGQAVDALGRVGAAGGNAANQIRNAMGEMVTAESDWAARSGQYFNAVSQQAASTASSISKMNSGMSGGFGGGGVSQSYSAPSSQGFSDGWGISDVSRGSGYGISSLSQSFGRSTFATGGAFEVGGHGGTDSQLIQFMATPGERVTVETPGQQAAGRGGYQNTGGGSPINVKMTIVTPDANSFRENESQISLRMANRIRTIQSKLGGA